MDTTVRRRLASWILLAVYLPVLVLSSVHVHKAEWAGETECAECVHHQCHGHLTQYAGELHQCVLCQFLTLSYPLATTLLLVSFFPEGRLHYTTATCVSHSCKSGPVGLRAPPTV